MKRQRNEGVEAVDAGLRFAQPDQMIDSVFERLDVAVEHGGVAGHALAVQLLVNLDPICARDLVRANLCARRFGEDLGGAAVDVVEPRLLERRDDRGKR